MPELAIKGNKEMAAVAATKTNLSAEFGNAVLGAASLQSFSHSQKGDRPLGYDLDSRLLDVSFL